MFSGPKRQLSIVGWIAFMLLSFSEKHIEPRFLVLNVFCNICYFGAFQAQTICLIVGLSAFIFCSFSERQKYILTSAVELVLRTW